MIANLRNISRAAKRARVGPSDLGAVSQAISLTRAHLASHCASSAASLAMSGPIAHVEVTQPTHHPWYPPTTVVITWLSARSQMRHRCPRMSRVRVPLLIRLVDISIHVMAFRPPMIPLIAIQ